MFNGMTKAGLALSAIALAIAPPSAAQKGRTAPVRPATTAAPASLVVPLPPGAPFSRLLIRRVSTSACPRNGCELSITGVSASGQARDITFDDVITNGFLGTRPQMVGASDSTGMPRLTYEQSNVGGDNTFNVFDYDRSAGRYRFKGTVDGYGKALEAPLQPSNVVRAAPTTLPEGAERSITYAGIATYKRRNFVQGLELNIKGTEVSGKFAQRILGQTLVTKTSGEMTGGRCTLKIGQDTLLGPCDARGFSGERLSKSGEVVGTFQFREKSLALTEGFAQ